MILSGSLEPVTVSYPQSMTSRQPSRNDAHTGETEMYIKLEWVLLFSALLILNAMMGHGIAVGVANSIMQTWLLRPILDSRLFATDHAEAVA